MCIWGVADGELRKTLTGHEGATYAVAFSHDGSLLASGAYESGSSSSTSFTSSNGRSTTVRTVTTVDRGVKTTRTTRTTRDEHGREETTTEEHSEPLAGGVFCYAGKAHPEFSPPGSLELVFSYMCNTDGIPPLLNRTDIYVPQLVRVAILGEERG